jgi:hypothetical protein
MGRFEGQVVIVTGGSDGIGLSVAQGFVEQGAIIVLVARGIDRLNKVARELGKLGGTVLVVPMDVSDFGACNELVDRVASQFGAIHGLVNNAALHNRGEFVSHPPGELAQMVSVNLAAPVYLTRACLPFLEKTKGFVVNLASLAGCVPTPGSAVYSATKFGLRAFSRALAEEVRPQGVRVSVVSPGPVNTAFIMNNLDEVTDLTLSQPVIAADEVARAVLDCAWDGRLERKLPRQSALLTTLAYLAPTLARRIRPLLEKKGRRKRLGLIAQREASGD